MKQILVLFLFAVLLSACGKEKVVVPNTSAIDVDFDLLRLERDLMSLDTNGIQESLIDLINSHPAFLEIYLNNIMGFKSTDGLEEQARNIKGFIQDDNINLLYQAVQLQYGDFDELLKSFESAFKLYKHYFPERNVPDLYTFISEYGIQRFVFLDEEGKDAVGIGLDLFLGAEYPYHQFIPNNPAFSNYLIRRFNRDHLVKRVMGALVEDLLGPSSGNNLLDKMIHNGKKLYILDHLLPYESDTIIMEYTLPQLEWCQQNELEMWAYFLKEDLFYQSDIDKINKLVNPSPNSPGMPREAPGRTGNYMGWKIIEAYMERHPNKNIKDLIEMTDAQKILELSKYKPRKR